MVASFCKLKENLDPQISKRDAEVRMQKRSRATSSGASPSGSVVTTPPYRSAPQDPQASTGASRSHTAVPDHVCNDSSPQLTPKSTQGLESCEYAGPSTIDFRTLVQSGPLPLVFLRGVGLPDNVIDYLPSLLNEPFQFYSCFISYSSADQAFAERLHADLQDKGVHCWFAPHSIQGGKKIHEQIDQAIRVYDKLLLILSDQSINSPWVEFEIRKARKRKVQEKRRVLFPVGLIDYATLEGWECFDADTKKDLATEIREYFICLFY